MARQIPQLGPGDPSPSQSPTVPPPQPTTANAPDTGPGPLDSPAPLVPGTIISRYRIESVLGAGGMGVVYLARQQRPDRLVALKVIRPGYATEKMLRRFEHEAEVLGRLLHPGIAQIYEAGLAAGAQGAAPVPFFAMELVNGVPLTRYAQHHKLGTRQRLELMAKVCDAVQHAHQKGVIHRDLKPGNILVTDEGPPAGDQVHPLPSGAAHAPAPHGQPKILDFGIARVTDTDVKSTTLQTDIGQLIGTIPYMSPEQVGGDPADLDTRSDVYALGVILYELLAGRLPYLLEKRLIHEAVRVIREEEPTRLSGIDRTLRGDVETIVAHALEKDKTRRYGAASALAADIRRYLADEPIAARPPSTWYQLTKFTKRNTALVVGVAATFAMLVAGLAGTAYGLAEARRQRDDALGARNAEKAARQAETQRADQLKKVSDFQSAMLGQVDPNDAGRLLSDAVIAKFDAALKASGVPDADRPPQVDSFTGQWRRVNATDAARELIDRTILTPAVAAIEKQFKDQPLVDAQLRQVLAVRYRDLGLLEAAMPLQERALATRRTVLGDDHRDTLASATEMAVLLEQQGKHDQAEPLSRATLASLRRALGEEHPDTLIAINNLGMLLQRRGRFAEAEPFCREALEKLRRVSGDDDPHSLTALGNLGLLLRAQGRLAEAEPYYREALERRLRLDPEHPTTLICLSNMGELLRNQGKLADSERCFREALEKTRKSLGEEHPSTITGISNLGLIYQSQERLGEAESCYRESLEKRRRLLGGEHPDTLTSINNLAAVLRTEGRLAEAEPLQREVLEKCRRLQGEDHPDTLICINNMGSLLGSQGRLDEAEPFCREALEKHSRILGPEHPNTLMATRNMGRLLQAQGKFDESEAVLLPAVAIADATLPPRHAARIALTKMLVALYKSWDAATPGQGYDAKAAHWNTRLETLQPAGSNPR